MGSEVGSTRRFVCDLKLPDFKITPSFIQNKRKNDNIRIQFIKPTLADGCLRARTINPGKGSKALLALFLPSI